jgi:hypothetical protein
MQRLRTPSLFQSCSSLVREWHPTRNKALTPEMVSATSHARVWWRCKRGHEWRAVIRERTRGHGFCKACRSLGVIYPRLAQEWHPTRNVKLTPFDVSARSDRKVWWRCPRGHSWKASIKNRSVNETGCGYCSGNLLTPERSPQETYPHVGINWCGGGALLAATNGRRESDQEPGGIAVHIAQATVSAQTTILRFCSRNWRMNGIQPRMAI